MKNLSVFVFLLFLFCCISSGYASAETVWVDLHSIHHGQAPGVSVVETDAGLDVSIEIFGFYAATIQRDSRQFHQLTIPRCGSGGEVGSPEMPFRNIFLAIPHGVKVNYQVRWDIPVLVMSDVTIFPRQAPQPENSKKPTIFSFNSQSYEKNANFPLGNVRRTMDGVIRGNRLIAFEVSPLQYNPARREVTAYPRVTISITFEGKANAILENKKNERKNPFFQNWLSSFVENFKAHDKEGTTLKSVGTEYLIIVDDDFVDEIAPLVTWKRLKGCTVEVVPTSTTGPTTDNIRDYIQNEYDINSSLTYIVLVGDHQQIPGYPVSPDAYGNPYVSDLPYSLLEGTDYFPDVVLGRICVGTEAECATVANKLVTYDRQPDAGDWYEKFLLAAYLQDYDGGCQADRWFFETGTHVLHFLRDDIGLTTRTSATSDSLTCDPYLFRSDSYPHRPAHPAEVPADDAALITGGATATQDIIDAVNEGMALVQHRDHGGEEGWGDPYFQVSHVNNDLTNGDMTPVVFSINCLTGCFDYGSGDCFAEAFLKKSGGGAIGVVAATRVSYSGWNDLLTHGLYDCFWDNYDTADGGNTYSHSWRPAEALMYAKSYMYTWEGDNDDTKYEFRLFEWFGDPEMMLRVGTQITPVVSHVSSIPVGVATLDVDCSVDDAVAAVTDGETLLGKAVVSGGSAAVTLDPAPILPTTLNVVVTGHNLIPYEGTVQVEWGPCGTTPEAQTGSASSVGGTVATLNGSGNPQGCNAIGFFEYGLTDAYGQVTESVYLGNGSSLVPYNATVTGLQTGTPYHFRAVVESGGGIVTGDDETFTTFVPTPLNPPVLQSPTDGQSDLSPADVTLMWQDTNTAPNELNVEIRYKKSDQAEYVYLTMPADSQQEDLPVLFGNATYQWNVRALGDGNLTVDSDWASVADWTFSTTGLDVLIVNGDDDTDYSSYFTSAVDAAGYSNEVFMRTPSTPVTLSLLSQYKSVVWTTGNDWTNTMTGDEETALKDYLDAGGSLYMSSQDYIYDLHGGSSGTTSGGTLLRDYLCVDWYDSDVLDYPSVDGLDIMAGVNPSLNASTPMNSYFDYITPTGDAVSIFQVTGTTYFAGHHTVAKDFRMVFAVFPFENITEESDRNLIMEIILQDLIPQGTPLNAPTLVSPTNGAVDQPLDATLEWTDTNSSPNETQYEIRYKMVTDPDYTTVSVDTDTTSHQLAGLLSASLYYWNVRAIGDGVTTANSSWANSGTDWSFTTLPLLVLNTPALVSPDDAASNQPPDVTLEWTDPNSSPNEDYYEIRYKEATEGDYTLVRVDPDETSWLFTGGAFQKIYSWNVRALGDGVSTADSAWANSGTDWSFSRGLKGDVDGNGVVDDQDLMQLADYLAGSISGEKIFPWNGDMDEDSVVNGLDLTLLIVQLNQ